MTVLKGFPLPFSIRNTRGALLWLVLGISSFPGEISAKDAGLSFSAKPNAEEISRARVFEEPLVPVGGVPTEAENESLADSLGKYSQRYGADDFTALTAFIGKYPLSPWNASLLTGLGFEYYNTAHYSKALAAWQQAWALAKDETGSKGKAIGDRTVGELAYMYARLGRMTELEALLKSVEGRVFVGPATEKISGAKEGLWNMQNRPEIAFRCGPLALHRIKATLGANQAADMTIFNSASTQKGMSLSQVAEISKKVGLNYQMAFREKGGDFVIPSVVHWKVSHYAAMVRQEGDKYLLEDPTFGNTVWATRAALEAETSGYFLIPPGPLPKGWRAVESKEGEKVWGKGFTSNNDPRPTCQNDPTMSKSRACKLGAKLLDNYYNKKYPKIKLNSEPGAPKPAGYNEKDPYDGLIENGGRGMAVSDVHLMLVNLNLVDEPVGYSPPVGPDVRFTVRYNHRDAFQPSTFTYANFGPKWTCDWISYITDNPQSASADVNHYVQGGGTRTYTGFNTDTQTFAYQQYDQTRLTRIATSPISYEMLAGDGSKLIFSQSDGSVGTSRKIFLTQVIDPFTNAVTLFYDSSLRLTNITDAIGQVTMLSYSNAIDTKKITRVTDPFGRFASFNYDSLGRLTNITDVIGLTSRFAYEGSGDFVNALITPYGTTSFTRGGSGTTRWLETLYPDGSKDRVEFNQSTVPGTPNSDAATSVPQGMSTANSYLSARNTYYWSRSACATGYGDYTKAKIYHWLHTADVTTCSGILESTKEVLERRVWYDYDGQSSSIFVGSTDRPKHVGRVLDDGSTQLSTFGFNGFGNLTNTIDPVGRTFSYLYDTNGIDLLQVRMTRAGKNELLFSASYNSQHLPLTTTDAAGQTTTNTYNPRGQLLATTNPKGETTTYTYHTNGYLIAVDGPLPGTNDVTTATYDAFGRTHNKTDESGYTISFGYDALDRITNITFPDSTFRQITYNRLDPSVVRDRAGRLTILEHNALGELTKRTDALGRVTQFQWCHCGAMKSLTDAMGRTTEWRTDVQGRMIGKQYGDGSQISYSYDAAGRIREILDEKLQIKQFNYNPDNTLRSVKYLQTPVATPVVSYAYDPDYARPTSRTDGVGNTVYSYAPVTSPPTLDAGKLVSEDGPLSNDTITYGYDELGRRASTAIDGLASRVVWDAAGRVFAETNAIGGFSYGYDGASYRLISETFPNGLVTSRSYGSNLQDQSLQQIKHQVGVTPVSEFTYGYDATTARIATWSQQAGMQTPDLHSLSYDNANQLLSASVTNAGLPVTEFAYVYDPAGNRLSERTGASNFTASYNPLNQLSGSSSPGTSRTNEWDAEDRLVAVNSGNQRTEFAYDGFSRLASIRHVTNGVQASLRRFIWCDDKICDERDASGVITKRFFRQGVRVETGPNSGNFYYTRDHLGSIRELTDAVGNLRARYAYDPFGRRSRVTGDMDTDFGFAAMFWTPEASLNLTWFRAYDPKLGRWLSRDPLQDAETEEGPNLYSYVGNNPVNWVDPLGLRCEAEGKRYSDARTKTEEADRKQNIKYKECEGKVGTPDFKTCIAEAEKLQREWTDAANKKNIAEDVWEKCLTTPENKCKGKK